MESKRTMRSKRKVIKPSPTGEEIESVYCRICMTSKITSKFYETTDPFIDRNGYMSICKECINDLYNKFFVSEGTCEKAILRLCRILNVAFDVAAVNAAVIHIDKRSSGGKDMEGTFGIYKSKLTNFQRINKDLPLTFSEPGMSLSLTDTLDDTEENRDIKQFWGEGMSVGDYEFLERELSDWQKTHKSDTKAEVTLLKEICFKQLEIRKARLEQKSVDSALKALQELMKTASVDPAKANVASGGKSVETFGQFVRVIEEKEPAEVFQDKTLFADFDGIEKYLKRYLYRPIKNFILGSKDFNINDEEEIADDEIDLDAMVDNNSEESDA